MRMCVICINVHEYVHVSMYACMSMYMCVHVCHLRELIRHNVRS